MAGALRLCSVDGCEGKHRARGLCSKHWKQEYGTATRYSITCTVCGAESMSARKDGKYCSNSCRGKGERNIESAWHAGATKRYRALQRLSKAAGGTKGRTWVAGACQRCGSAYVAVNARLKPRFCSVQCNSLAKKQARRARVRGNGAEPYSRTAVFVRDNWTCHLCGSLVEQGAHHLDPKAPTIDHLTPIARGGADALSNVATAHRQCNSIKSDRLDHGH
jgi:hypothetical protein